MFASRQTLPLDDFVTLLPFVLTLAGPLLHLYLPIHGADLEQRVDRNQMTGDDARRQLRFYRGCARFATVLGLTLLGVQVYRLLR